MGYLIDTCIWIDVEQGCLLPADIVTITGMQPVYLSPITIAELKFGAEVAADQGIRQQRLASLARIFGSLAAQLKVSGRTHRPRIQDLWLASQAIQHGLTLLTRNMRDFADIPGLQLGTV